MLKEKILKLHALGMSYRKIALEVNCAHSTVAYHCGPEQRAKSADRQKARRRRNFKARLADSTNNFQSHKNGKIGKELRNKALDYQKRGGKADSGTINKGRKFTVSDVLGEFGEQTNCYLTGRSIDFREPKTFHFDHIVPTSRGGDNSFNNLGIACKDANFAKGSLLIDEFLILCADVLKYHGYSVKSPKKS